MPQPPRDRAWRRLVVTAIAVALGFGTLAAAPANAASASDFDPGYLISDEAFFDSDALSAGETMTFIYGMNKGCLTGRVCIENYRESITAKSANSRCKAITAKSNQNAGQIISTVALSCGISPKAILVILQKEQSLITAQAPGSRAFQAAMGAGCPDTAPCDGKYAGFYEQVYYGAYLLKGYTIPGSSNYGRYAAGEVSRIAYSPRSYGSSPTCGFKSVYVKNQATHALYVYTPYTPNAAALANLYGTGDSCSAYGNRNFWRMYTDWWGPTGSAAALKIDAAYAARGGATGWLGAALTGYVGVSEGGGGVYRRYEEGTIVYGTSTGLKIISAPLDGIWITNGAVAKYGWPLSSTARYDATETGVAQDFQKATLTRMDNKNVIVVWAGMRESWWASGGPSSYLGWPIRSRAADETGLYSQPFRNGTLFADATRAGGVENRLLDNWLARKGITGSLQWPNSDAVVTEDGGVYQSFDKGMLFATPSSSFVPLFGTFPAAFDGLGGLPATGWPLAPREATTTSGLLRQSFERGTVFTYGTQYALVATPLADKAVSAGIISGKLGMTTSTWKESTENGGGIYQYFKGAMLTKQGENPAVALIGPMRTAYTSTGREVGILGWPTTDVYVDKSTKANAQDFQFGTVFSVSSKYGIVGSNVAPSARKYGVTTTKLGWPKAEQRAAQSWGGGYYQHFDKGTVTVSNSYGGVLVPTVIWSAHSRAGGLSGLGWPKAAAKTSSTGTITQVFDGATITWTKAKGAVVKLTK